MAATIVHVDDDEDIRASVNTILSREGYDVHSYATIEGCFDELPKLEVDLFILDVMVEEVDSGLKAFDKLRESSPNTPTILLSSLGEMVLPYFEQQQGMIWVLRKPVSPSDLLSAVQSRLK